MDNDHAGQPINEYEALRAARIASNKQRMEELGVVQAAQQLKAAQQKPVRWRPPSNKPKTKPVVEPVATRVSKRLRGQPVEAAAAQQVDTDQQDQSTSYSDNPHSSKKAKQNPNEPRFELTNTLYAAPFLLPSIGVIVHALGEIYRGPFSNNFWSSRGSLYRHMYPVGYHASKEAFGHTWDMHIAAAEGEPVFTVSQRGGSRSFSGPSPTKPWTDICLAFRPGQRISGPLYFGFSDVHVQRALAAMYTPAELAYALYGTSDTAAAAAAAAAATTATAPGSQPQQHEQQQQEAAADSAAGAAKSSTGDDSRGSSDTSQQQLQAPQEQQQQQPAVKPLFELTDTVYAAPFVLLCSDVTVYSLGEIYRGPCEMNYWSSKCASYRHAYPVGYRASKEAFGHTWDMEISAGDRGPVLTVTQRGGSLTFSGPNPTKPWTEVCLAFRTTKRVSGPLYFGFPDIHVQRALAAMYTPAELSYALYGTWIPPVAAAAAAAQPDATTQHQQQPGVPSAAGSEGPKASAAPSSSGSTDTGLQQPGSSGADQQQQHVQDLYAAEAFADELQSIKGIGAATAQVLALTTSLGGARHSSLQAFCSWLKADPQHAQQLQHYLLNSEEVPRCSRQLPSWREKWVPMIMQQLAQLQGQQPQQH